MTIVILSALATYYAIRSGMLRKELVPTLMALCFAYSFYYGIIHLYFIRRPKLLTQFPSATALPLHAYWWPHSLAALTTITKSDCFRLLRRWLLRVGVAVYVYWAYTRGMLHPLLAAVMIPVFIMQLIQPVVLLVSLALMRYRLGGLPTARDLKLVDPPPGLLRA